MFVVQSRVSECQQRVHDLLDLQLCSNGVQTALRNEDFEKAAAHVHRFLSMDQHLLKQTADDVAEGTEYINSIELLFSQYSTSKNRISIMPNTTCVHNKISNTVTRACNLNQPSTRYSDEFFCCFSVLPD